MTFSITAGGTQQEALKSLAAVTQHDELGKAAADLLIQAIGSGPAEVQFIKRFQPMEHFRVRKLHNFGFSQRLTPQGNYAKLPHPQDCEQAKHGGRAES